MVNISSGITLFVRWFPFVLFMIMEVLALYQGVALNSAELALAIGIGGFVFPLIWFLVYGRYLWTLKVGGNKLVFSKFGRTLETTRENIRRIELFPDVLFRGQQPQYELLFKESTSEFQSIRFYPNAAGKIWLDEIQRELRKSTVKHGRR